MRHLKQHIFRLIAIVTLAFGVLPPLQAGAAGIEMVLCTPDGYKTVLMPGSKQPPQNHDCADCCCTAIIVLLPQCSELPRAALLTRRDFPVQQNQPTTLFTQAVLPRGPPLTV